MTFERDSNGQVLFRDPRGGGLVHVTGYDPNTGTIKWRAVGSPFTGSTKLTPEMTGEYVKAAQGGSPSQPASGAVFDLGGGRVVTGGSASLADAPGATAAASSPSPQAGPSDTMKLLDEYIAQLREPINADSSNPYVQSVVQGATSQASRAARGRGIEGGLSLAATQQNVAGAMGQLEGQRMDRLGRAIALKGQQGLSEDAARLGLERFREEQYQWDAKNSLAADAARGESGWGSLAGMAAGGIASIFAPGAAQYLVPGGASLGAGLEKTLFGQPQRSSFPQRRTYNPAQVY